MQADRCCFQSILDNLPPRLSSVFEVASSSFEDYLIKSDSRSGSRTPFWSLFLSNPSAVSARTVTFTLPARSARFAMAFHAENNWFRSAEKLISTDFWAANASEGDAP